MVRDELMSKLAHLGVSVPHTASQPSAFVPAVRCDRLVFVSGHTSVDGDSGKGSVETSTVDGASAGARLAAAKCLVAATGPLEAGERLARVLRVTVFVASAGGFQAQPRVADGASLLVTELFGSDAGRHARSAIGVAELPGGASVEVEMIVEIGAASAR
jgi:enamine deaminase RidA (YjgF/YER057c/UK114 family)